MEFYYAAMKYNLPPQIGFGTRLCKIILFCTEKSYFCLFNESVSLFIFVTWFVQIHSKAFDGCNIHLSSLLTLHIHVYKLNVTHKICYRTSSNQRKYLRHVKCVALKLCWLFISHEKWRNVKVIKINLVHFWCFLVAYELSNPFPTQIREVKTCMYH